MMKVVSLSPNQMFLGVSLLVTYASTASALYCYSCTHNKVESDTKVVSWFLDSLSSLSDEHCLLRQDFDRNEAHQRECPQPESGKVAKCVVINGTATADIEIAGFSVTEVKYHSVVRDCIEVDPDDGDYSNGCHDDLPSTTHSVFDDAFDKLSLGDLSFKGKACYSGDKDEYSDTSSASRTMALWATTIAAVAAMCLSWIGTNFHQ